MKNMPIYIFGGLLVLVVGGTIALKSRGSSSPQPVIQGTSSSTVSVAVSTDPQDIVPGTYANPIKNTATTDGLAVVSGIVENNVDANGKSADDHLEIVFKNTSANDMKDFEVYYTVTDPTTGKSEGYYKKLTGFMLASGESKAVHFDGKAGPNHYGVNTNGLYFTSVNQLKFDVQVSAPGFKMAKLQIMKDAGGAELKD